MFTYEINQTSVNIPEIVYDMIIYCKVKSKKNVKKDIGKTNKVKPFVMKSYNISQPRRNNY